MELPDHSSAGELTDGLKIVCYAVNGKGEYALTPDFVWQPVHVVNHQAWQEIEKNIAASKDKIAAGRASCLHYYMTANQMDPGLLAQYTDQPRWKVCLHLLPFIFNRLSAKTLQKYAELYRISPDDLTQGRLQPLIPNHE